MPDELDERTVSNIAELSYAAGMARGTKEGIDLMLDAECFTALEVRKVANNCLSIAMLIESVVRDMAGIAED